MVPPRRLGKHGQQMAIHPIQLLFGILTLTVVITTIPYALVGIEYRNRDNGLAYLVFVIGLGLWNGMVFLQLLSSEQRVKIFFLGLSVVGAVLAGLGWFLFASTAGVTSGLLARRDVYATVAFLGGVDVILAVTTPIHMLFWAPSADPGPPFGLAAVDLTVGYWLHTVFLAGLILAGTGLFWQRWRRGSESPYPRIYSVAGVTTVAVLLAGNLLAPWGLAVAPVVAVTLSTAGWFQASREQPFQWIRSLG